MHFYSEKYKLSKIIPKVIGAIIGISFLISPWTTLIWVGIGLAAMILFLAVIVVCYAPRNSIENVAPPTRRRARTFADYSKWDDSLIPAFLPDDICTVGGCSNRFHEDSAFIHVPEWD